MRHYLRQLFLIGLFLHVINCLSQEKENHGVSELPTVFLSIISRNEGHTLATYLGYIETLDYPKERISILIQTDHNEDNTHEVLQTWKNNVEKDYHKVELRHEEEPKFYSDAKGPNHWIAERYHKLLKSKQNALDEARKDGSDYIFFVDGDNFLTEPKTLRLLIDEKKTIIAPMLRLFQSKSAYSNFWGGIDENGYYKRVDSYFEILRWEKVGSFPVPMVHSTYLIELRNNKTDQFKLSPIPSTYAGEIDDILVFAHTARLLGMEMNICNKVHFGYLLNTCTENMSLEDKKVMFTDTLVEHMAYNPPLIRSTNAAYKFPAPSYAGFDEIFMINLKRREDRYQRMRDTLAELGLKWKHFAAVDGKTFTQEKVSELGIVAMNDFKDPYLERPLTFGEIGCFLSHYYIWQEMVERKLETVLVLEDDVRFEFDFVRKLKEVMNQADKISSAVNWDLIYLGRKHMSRTREHFVKGANKIVWARYSYWTLGYVLKLSGAKKLLAGNPLGKMVPVDEYIPIMFDDHPDEWLLKRFPIRNLVGLSADPLLMYPTHYVGDEGYISDTEDTLSFEGESVEHFRKIKEEEKQKNKNKNENKNESEVVKSPKTQSDTIKPKPDGVEKVGDASQALHGEL